MARLLIREQAWADLEELGAFIAKDNPSAAAEVVRELRISFEQLARMPQLGRMVKKIKTSEQLRMWLSPAFRNYLIFIANYRLALKSCVSCMERAIFRGFWKTQLDMPNNVPRNHHYVCEFLLKNFADEDGTLWIYDSELQKYWAGNTRSGGFERDLYALTLRGRGRDFKILEKGLERQIDTPGAVAIRKLSNREICDAMEWANFLRFVAAQMVRTPEYIDQLKAMLVPVMQEMLERMSKFDPEFREGVRHDMKEGGATNEDVERVLETVANWKCRAQPTQDWIVAHAVHMIPAISDGAAGYELDVSGSS